MTIRCRKIHCFKHAGRNGSATKDKALRNYCADKISKRCLFEKLPFWKKLSFNKHVKVFATPKAMELSSRIRNILTVQNIWLSILGILLGAPLGRATLNAMMNSNRDSYDYNFRLSAGTYLAVGLLVLFISMLTSFFFSKRIKRLDMVEVLKGVE